MTFSEEAGKPNGKLLYRTISHEDNMSKFLHEIVQGERLMKKGKKQIGNLDLINNHHPHLYHVIIPIYPTQCLS